MRLSSVFSWRKLNFLYCTMHRISKICFHCVSPPFSVATIFQFLNQIVRIRPQERCKTYAEMCIRNKLTRTKSSKRKLNRFEVQLQLYNLPVMSKIDNKTFSLYILSTSLFSAHYQE